MIKARNTTCRKAIERILKPLQENFNIDYFTYCRYSDTNCDLISSDNEAAFKFLNDKESHMPAHVTNTNSIINWREYCSQAYHEYIVNRYNRNPNGITFVLRHNDSEAEHITLHTSDKEIDLLSQMQSQRKISSNIISHIRNNIQMHKSEFNSIYFKTTSSLKKISQTENQADYLSSFTREYIFGAKGETYLTRAEIKYLKLSLELKTAKEIAEEMELHQKTIESHLSNIRKKLGINKRHQLFQIACNNLISTNNHEEH